MDTSVKLDSALDDIIDNEEKSSPNMNGKSFKPRQRQGPYPGRGARVPRGRQVRGNRVYVGNLHFSVSWQELKDHMRQAGEVAHAKILQNPDGSSKGCGIVEFSSPQDAERAINELNNSLINGRSIFIREDRDVAPPANANNYGQFYNQPYNTNFGYNNNANNANANYGYEYKQPFPNRRKITNDIGSSIRFNHPPEHQVYVGNLPWTCAWQDLKTLASKYGQVVRADILEDAATGRSRGAGTVVFTSGEAAAACIEALNGTDYESRKLTVRLDAAAQKRAERVEPDTELAYEPAYDDFVDNSFADHEYKQPTHYRESNDLTGAKLFVGNLPWSASWQDLKDLFAKYGEVVRADIAIERQTGKSKGFGTVAFSKKSDADAAMSALNETEFRGRNIQVRPDQYNPKHNDQ